MSDLHGTANKENLIVSGLHKPRGYMQGLLIEAEYVVEMNKLPFSIKQRDKRQASNWVFERSQPNIIETRLDTDNKEQLETITTRCWMA
jgi:hypothetical protein